VQGNWYISIKTLAEMKSYTPQNQLSFESFQTPFDQHLDEGNKWVKLADKIPWDDCVAIYLKSLSDFGRPGIDGRLAVGALIIKHLKKLSDRGVIEELSENVYLQYFVGFSSFKTEAAFDASLFVSLRKRMGLEAFDQMNDIIISKALNIEEENQDKNENESKEEYSEKQVKTPNQGKLKIDATVADQMIVYPTDLGLLNRSRQELERLIDQLHGSRKGKEKPRTYRKNANKEYLSIATKKRRSRKTIQKGIKKQLNYVKRNIKTVNSLWDELEQQRSPLNYRDLKLFWVIQQVYEQQLKMFKEKTKSHAHRIVNIYQAYVRPIPRGKSKGNTEFGSKLGVSEFEGFCRLDHLSWEAYHEGKKDLKNQVERYRKLNGYYPEVVLCDGIYMTRENRQWLKAKEIRHIGKQLGRPSQKSSKEKKKLKEERGMRNTIEGKFGQGKNAYGLSNIRSRTKATSESWIAAIFFAMNLVRWNKVVIMVLWSCYQIALFFNAIFEEIKPLIIVSTKSSVNERRNLNGKTFFSLAKFDDF
jgi:hypothetical protein